MQRLGLEEYAHKTVDTFSGGTKRKLSVAVALLGDPDLVLLVSCSEKKKSKKVGDWLGKTVD